MDAVFYGLIFLLIDIRINNVSLTPTFVGYILLYAGLGQVQHESGRFAALRPWCLGMTVYQLFLYAVSLFGGFSQSSVNLLLSLAGTAAGLYILYRFIQGVAETESHYPGAELESATLRQRWWWLLILSGVQALASALSVQTVFALLLVLAGFVVTVLFLMAFHRCRRAYAAAVKQAADGPAADGGGQETFRDPAAE